ncbi:MAG: hypothetical protein A2283_01555 [Lentisphaerae bacterium RIFOXYA12_FULL_48_11]|nr:MAG: hypothetical protein A2283_01555 [Lentisphaerae bacterium RIFOXYA12_FULL_48_11]
MVLLIMVTAGTLTYLAYKSEKKALLEVIDSKLFAVANMAKATLPSDHHDKIIDANSISAEEFRRIIERNDLICKTLDLQYIWSLMQLNNHIVFTSSTSTSKDTDKHDHAHFLDIHTNPEAYEEVFSTMQTCYSTFDDKWGKGRMVLIPGTDKNGRKYCFGASMSVEKVDQVLLSALQKPLRLSALILLAGAVVAFLLANSVSKPVTELTSMAEDIAKGNFDQKFNIRGASEIRSLSHSINAMRLAIKERIIEVTESEQRFRSIFEEGLIGIVFINSDTRFINVNPAFCKITGYSREELLTKTFPDITHPDHTKIDMENVNKLAKGEIPYYRTKKRYIRKDGQTVWVNLNVSVIRDQSGELLYLLGMIEDITTTENLDNQLRQNEEKFRTLFENITEGVAIHEVIYDEKGRAVNYRIVDVNPAYEKHTGIHPAHAKNKLATELYGTESAPYLPIWGKVAETGTPHHMEVFFAPMNKYFYIACCSPRKGWFATVFTDITEKKQLEDTLIQNEEKFRSLVETSSDWIWETDKNGICTYASPRIKDLLGYTPTEAIGRKAIDFIAQDALKTFNSQITRLYVSPKTFYGMEQKCIHKDGHIVILEGSGAPFFDANGIFKGYRGINRDITERKRQQEALLLSATQLRANLESTPNVAIQWYDLDGRILYWNPASEKMYGWKAEEAMGKTLDALIYTPELAADFHRLLRDIQATGKPAGPFESEFQRLDGTSGWLISTTFKIPMGEGKSAFVCMDVDITGRKQAEEEVRKLNAELEQRVRDRTLQLELANKELKAFSYSVSHDLRAPLRSIDGFSTAILEDYSDKLDGEGRDYLQRLRRASQRMASLIDDMLKLSKVTSGDMHISNVNLSQMVEDFIADLREADPQRNIEAVITPGINVSADPQLMHAVMENLLGNAWKFTSKNANARIEFGTMKPENETTYYVRDNGAGFDMAFINKLFCAFQRLHSVEDYPGDGIGLASVQRIIHRHGGRIWAEGKQNHGATFYFTLGLTNTEPKES